MIITNKSENIKIKGYKGTWYVVDNTIRGARKIFLLEHEQYGDDAACIIVDVIGGVLVDEAYNGFLDYDEMINDDIERMYC